MAPKARKGTKDNRKEASIIISLIVVGSSNFFIVCLLNGLILNKFLLKHLLFSLEMFTNDPAN